MVCYAAKGTPLSLSGLRLTAFDFFLPEGVKAKVYFKASPQPTEDGFTFMNIESVKMDFSVRDIKMGVDNIANGNSIIRESESSSGIGNPVANHPHTLDPFPYRGRP